MELLDAYKFCGSIVRSGRDCGLHIASMPKSDRVSPGTMGSAKPRATIRTCFSDAARRHASV